VTERRRPIYLAHIVTMARRTTVTASHDISVVLRSRQVHTSLRTT